MIRARLYLSGNDTWKTTTEGTIRPSAWITNTGLKWNWTYSFSGGSISVSRTGKSGITISELKNLLNAHPEGIVLYCGKYPHAVFVTDYEGDTFYCADPGSTSYPKQRIKLVDGVMKKKYNTQAKVLSNVTAYWCVTSYSITPTEKPVTIGEDFYAVIRNTANEKSIVKDEDNIIRLRGEDGNADQVWRFELQNDGSYKIVSTENGQILSMAPTGNGMVVEDDKAYTWHRWVLYEKNGGYVIKTKYNENANLVLTLQGNNSADGTAIITAARDNSVSQIWTIYQDEEILLSPTALEVLPGNTAVQTKFDWADVYGESYYNVKIWKDQTDESEPYVTLNNVESGVGVLLEAGTYEAYVETGNFFGKEISNVVTFIIEEGEGLRGDVNADGTVDTSDAQAIFNHFMGGTVIESDELIGRADLNADGTVDTSDAQAAFNLFMNGQ